jgi:3-phosphoshikimate 1-carboxyvinyltransferase
LEDRRIIDKFPYGAVTLPPSKSILHREIIRSFLSGVSPDVPVGVSDDIDATARCMRALMTGADALDCAESGSTLRFLIPIAAALGRRVRFTGRGRLLSRPLTPFLDELTRHGAVCELTSDALFVSGQLTAGTYRLPGDISSQFVTGLLFALPILSGDSEIVLTSPLESAAYVDLTLDALSRAGVRVTVTGTGDYKIPGGQTYARGALIAEGDYSQAAFFLVAGALGRDVSVPGLREDSIQGDRAVLDILRAAGITLTRENGAIRALPGRAAPCDIDVSGIPDLVPPLAALFAYGDGASRLYNAARLRHKESDRLEAVRYELYALGADIRIEGDSLVITGQTRLRGGECDSRGDHRIAMMCAVAAIGCVGPVTLTGGGCVRKSYPGFWRDFEVSE